MSENYNMGALGVTAPFAAKEGTITITDGASAHGNIKVPVLSAPIQKGDFVKLSDDLQVEKAAASDTAIIGIAANTPQWEVEPTTNRTQEQAISAGELREVAVETVFKKILTVDAKASEGITAGKYLVWKNAVELSASSGTTATGLLALTNQDSDNRVVVGFL